MLCHSVAMTPFCIQNHTFDLRTVLNYVIDLNVEEWDLEIMYTNVNITCLYSCYNLEAFIF